MLEFLKKALSYSKAYLNLEREILNVSTAGAVYEILPETLRNRVLHKTRRQLYGSKDYLIKMIDIFTNELYSARRPSPSSNLTMLLQT